MDAEAKAAHLESIRRDVAEYHTESEWRWLLDSVLTRVVASGSPANPTISAYRSGILRFLSWCRVRGLDPRSASVPDLETYRADLAQAGLKPATVASKIAAVRVFYRALVHAGQVGADPSRFVRSPKIPRGPAQAAQKALSAVDVEKLLASVPGAGLGLRDGAILRLMVLEGLRVAEVAGLRWGDLSDGGLTFVGKGGDLRFVRLCSSSLKWLEAWKNWSGWQGPSIFGLCRRGVQKAVDRRMRDAGVKQPGKGCHSLRHSFALVAALNGADPLALQDKLGHSDPRTTQIYTRAAAQFLKNPSEIVEAALGLGNEGDR